MFVLPGSHDGRGAAHGFLLDDPRRSRNTVTISRWSSSSGWNRLMAPAWLIRCEPVKMSPSRQSVKSSPCSDQVIRCSSQKGSAMVLDIPGSLLVSVSGWGFGVLGWGWTPAACRQGMPPARRGFVRGQENDRPDAAHSFLTVSRRPAGFCRGRFTHSPATSLLLPGRCLGPALPQNARGWPQGGFYGPLRRFEVVFLP